MNSTFPNGRRGALSLSFDDARLSQIDRGMGILNEHTIRATFYVSPGAMDKRLEGWRDALKAGHEVGNHTFSHPCSGNFAFSRVNALEDYSIERIGKEIVDASAHIEKQLGVRPTTFAYPCGQFFVGCGAEQKSYVPLVAKDFLAGRGYLNEIPNDPAICDMAYLHSSGFDRLDFAAMKKSVDVAINEGRWLILAGHEVGDDGNQTVRAAALEELCKYCRQREGELWTDTVHNVAVHIAAARV